MPSKRSKVLEIPDLGNFAGHGQSNGNQPDCIDLTTLRLTFARPQRGGEAPEIRDFFGTKFEHEALIYNHGPNDQLIYQYPRVQFKVIDRFAFLMGINEGSRLLQRLWREFDPTCVANEKLSELEATLQSESASIQISDQPIRYRFATPWLALNPKNFREYTRSKSQSFRREKLDRTLVGNCLGMCKSLGICFIPDPNTAQRFRIDSDTSGLSSIKTTLNDQPMIGFIGSFTLNLLLPNYIGLGKSVARGFGVVEQRQ